MNRLSARQRGYTWRWQKVRAIYLAKNPLCAICKAQGKIAAATIVDHIIPHNGNQQLFWDESNWQSLCKSCHDQIKQAQDIRGFSNAVGIDGWPIDKQHPVNAKKF